MPNLRRNTRRPSCAWTRNGGSCRRTRHRQDGGGAVLQFNQIPGVLTFAAARLPSERAKSFAHFEQGLDAFLVILLSILLGRLSDGDGFAEIAEDVCGHRRQKKGHADAGALGDDDLAGLVVEVQTNELALIPGENQLSLPLRLRFRQDDVLADPCHRIHGGGRLEDAFPQICDTRIESCEAILKIYKNVTGNDGVIEMEHRLTSTSGSCPSSSACRGRHGSACRRVS